MTKGILRNEPTGTASTLVVSTDIGSYSITRSESYTHGGTSGGGTGDASLTISARRGEQQIAPEGIAFFAEVSGFDLVQPEGSTVYDPALHDVTYVWDFGDSGATYAAPENMLPEWRNANKGSGPFPSHVYTKPGTYTPLCAAIYKGTVAYAALPPITVQDPEAVFTAAGTVVCSTSGNFAGAAPHDVANRTTTLTAAMDRLTALRNEGIMCRLQLRGGEVFQMERQYFCSAARIRNVHFSAYGTGYAKIKHTVAGSTFIVSADLPVKGASFSGIDFEGPWDSTTETLDPANPIEGNCWAIDTADGFTTIHNCKASGLWSSFTKGKSVGMTLIVSNCQATNWEDYGFYVGGENNAGPTAPLTSYVGVLGCRFAQDRNALQGGNGKSMTDRGNRHGSFRAHAIGYLYVDALDGFSRNGWPVTAGLPSDQSVIRDHRNDPRSKGFFTRIMGEGGAALFSNGSATGDGNSACNTVLDKAYFLASARSSSILGISATAFTARNLIGHFPNIGGGNSANEGITVADASAHTFVPEALPEPYRIYNVTIINEKDEVQQKKNAQNSGDWTPVLVKTPGIGVPQFANIVVHRPNYPGGAVADAPLNNARLGFAPRYLGYAWKAHGTLVAKLPMDTSFATPSNPWSLWRPQAGSPAIGSATGLVAYDDLLGNVRPPQASRGAIEPA